MPHTACHPLFLWAALLPAGWPPGTPDDLAQEGARPSATPQEERAAEPPQTSEKAEPSAALLEAVGHMRAREFAAAEEVFRTRVLPAEPDNGSAWFFYGLALHQLGKYEEALTANVRAADLDGKRGSSALYNAACACARLGRIEEAFAWLDKAFAAGFDNRALVERDYDLNALRGDPRFRGYLPNAEVHRAPFRESVEVLYHFYGESKGDEFGWAGRSAGDCDGDGTNDILISAPFYSIPNVGGPQPGGSSAGRIYLYSGATGELLFARTGRPGERLGISVEAAGDVNDDGHADVIAGADGTSSSPGHAYVFSGKNGDLLLELSTGTPQEQFGWRVAGLGDVNGDGHGDLIVGAPAHCSPGELEGSAYVYSGRNGRLLATLRGEEVGDEFGSSVGGGVYDDGPYLVVGAASAGPLRRGRAYVYRFDGRELERVVTFDADPTGLRLGGMFISIVGDVNGDGRPDVYTSDWQNQVRGRNTGRAYVFCGTTGRAMLTLTGEHGGDSFGVGPGRAGDVDGDGRADLIVGAWQNRQGGTNAGKCYVFSGRDGRVLREITCTQPGDAFGFDATGLGDLDRDGHVDFLVTAAWSGCNGKKSGRAFVIRGEAPAPPTTAAADRD